MALKFIIIYHYANFYKNALNNIIFYVYFDKKAISAKQNILFQAHQNLAYP